MPNIDPSDVHYRLVVRQGAPSRVDVACVQDFDYPDYEGRFVTDQLFVTKEGAQWLADKINSRPWKIARHYDDLALVLDEAADAIAEENPLMDRGTDVSSWLRERAQKIRWGLL